MTDHLYKTRRGRVGVSVLLVAACSFVLGAASAGRTQSCYGYTYRYNYTYAWSPYVNEIITHDGKNWGQRTVSCSLGKADVWVDAWGVWDGYQYLMHEETAYGNATVNCTIGFPSPGPWMPKPDGLWVKAFTNASATYDMAGRGNPNFSCWVQPMAHCIDAHDIPGPISMPPPDPKVGSFAPLACQTPTQVQRPGYTSFECSRISCTAHAKPLGGTLPGAGNMVTSKGTTTASSWGLLAPFGCYYL